MDVVETPLSGGSRSIVSRRGDVVLRAPSTWSATVIAFLRHLEAEGFEHAPRVVGTGFDEMGREILTFVPGEFVHPGPWPTEALPILGAMLKRLHAAGVSFEPPTGASWRPWFGRSIGQPATISHCDLGPWNIVSRGRVPVAFIDWENAGPIDPLVELAQVAWLNAQLYDDDLAEREGLPSLEERALQVRLLLDGYGLPLAKRDGFIDLVQHFAILDAANETVEAAVTPESSDPSPLWAITWRTRSAGWITRNKAVLERILADTL